MRISPVTLWRLRNKKTPDGRPYLSTVNLCGRHYVTAEEIMEFKARLARGELAREPNRPQRKPAGKKPTARRTASVRRAP